MTRLALLVLLAASPAAAAIQPCYLDEMVAEAAIVVQVVEHEVTGPDWNGSCTLTGVVAQSFRGDIEVGSPYEMAFACSNPRGLAGGTVYHGAETVAQAGVIEIHATEDLAPAGYGQGLLPIEAPTEAPAYPFDHLGGC